MSGRKPKGKKSAHRALRDRAQARGARRKRDGKRLRAIVRGIDREMRRDRRRNPALAS